MDNEFKRNMERYFQTHRCPHCRSRVYLKQHQCPSCGFDLASWRWNYCKGMAAFFGIKISKPANPMDDFRQVSMGDQKGEMKSHKPHIIKSDSGLIPHWVWSPFFSGYPTDLIQLLREDLGKRIPNIREKVNVKLRYFGYSLAKSADKLFIYIQHKKIVIDIDIDQTGTSPGFTYTFRNNFQRRSGWLTGWLIPYDKLQDDRQRQEIVDVMCQAFLV